MSVLGVGECPLWVVVVVIIIINWYLVSIVLSDKHTDLLETETIMLL